MQKSQLVNVLKTFSKKEIRDCRKWLHSPYHNQREDCIDLFEYLCEHLQEDEFLDKERIYKKLFPKTPFDDARIRQTMYFLLKAIEDFLAYETFSRDDFKNKITLATNYRKRGLKNLYNKALKATHKAHVSSPYQDEDFFANELILLKEENVGLSEQRSTSRNLQEISDKLDKSYIVSKLKQACLMAADQNVYKIDYEKGLLEDVLSYVEENNFFDIPSISIYYYIYQSSLGKEQNQAFIKVKEQIFQYAHLFPNREASDIYLMAVNFCISRINKGKSSFIPEMFNLYREGIERKIFILDGILDRFLFRNIVTAGSYLKEFDWLEKFTDDYQEFLEPQYREDYVNLSKSMIMYNKKDYDKVLLLLTRYAFKDTLINLNGKAMLTKIYFELGEFTALDSLLESTAVFIKRKKDLSNTYRLSYNNLIKYTKKLLRVNPYDKAKREKLRQEILAANPLIEKRWFLEQLEKL